MLTDEDVFAFTHRFQLLLPHTCSFTLFHEPIYIFACLNYTHFMATWCEDTAPRGKYHDEVNKPLIETHQKTLFSSEVSIEWVMSMPGGAVVQISLVNLFNAISFSFLCYFFQRRLNRLAAVLFSSTADTTHTFTFYYAGCHRQCNTLLAVTDLANSLSRPTRSFCWKRTFYFSLFATKFQLTVSLQPLSNAFSKLFSHFCWQTAVCFAKC